MRRIIVARTIFRASTAQLREDYLSQWNRVQLVVTLDLLLQLVL